MQIFLGRERELRFLSDVLSDVLNGESRVVHIKGAKGLGKTSLVKEFLKNVPDNVVRIHSSHVRPGYGVIREFVKKFGDRRRLLGRVLPMEAVHIYPDLSSYFVFPEYDARPVDEYFILYEFLDRLSDVSPVVLVLDNMELYSAEDLELVRKLILSLEGKPIMFVLISTPDISFYRALAIDLEPLSLEDLMELHMPVEVVERLYRVTGGIPTLVNQLLFSMRHLNLDPQRAFSPEILGEIYGKILDLLSEEEKDFLLKMALTEYVDVQSPVFRHLRSLGLVDEEGIRLHGLKEYILGTMSEEERKSFYRREALSLLDEFREGEAFDLEKLHRLVRYMELSGLDEKYPEEFSKCALRLGNHYRKLNKYSLAMEFYSRVRVDPYRKEAARLRLLIAIKTGGHEDVDTLFQQVSDDREAVEQYAKYLLFKRRFEDYEKLVEGKESPILHLYYLYYRRDYARFKKKAMKMLDDMEGPDKLNLINFLANIYLMEGEREKAMDYLRILRAEAEMHGDLVIVSKALYHMGVLAYEMEDYDSAMEYAVKALDMARRSGYIYGQMYVHYFLGVFLQERGDYKRAGLHLEKALELAIVEKNDYIRISSTFRLSDDERKMAMVEDLLFNRSIYSHIFNRLALDIIVPFLARVDVAKARALLSEIKPERDFMEKIYSAYRAFLNGRKLPKKIPRLLMAQIYELKDSTLPKALEIYKELGFALKVMEISERLNIPSEFEREKVEIRTFGGLRLKDVAGREISGKDIGTYKAQQILLILVKAIWDDKNITTDDILAALWPEFDSQRALNNFHVNLTALRRVLGKKAIVKDKYFYRLNPEVVYLDLQEFKENYEKGIHYRNMGNPHKAYTYFERAVGVAGDRFLKGIYDPLFDDFIMQVNSAVMDALEFIGQYELERANYDKARRIAREILDIDYFNEKGHELAIRTMMESGRKSAALEYMRRVKRIFMEELGFEPEFHGIEKGGRV